MSIQPLTENEQYNLLTKLKEKLEFFNKHNEVSLSPSDFEILKTLYKQYFSKFQLFNTSCQSCVKDMLNVCIARYSALKKKFAIEPDAEAKIKVKKIYTKKGI